MRHVAKREFIDGDLSSAEHYGRQFHINYCKEDECACDGRKQVEERLDSRIFTWTLQEYKEWRGTLG
jgi:hypothetical protein